jgi:Flp pilus assembly protein TadD
MRPVRFHRGFKFAPVVLLAGMLGACSTFPGADADVGVTCNTQVAPASAPTPPLDQIKDDVGLGQMNFERENYGLAEMYFRRAVEKDPKDVSAWLGLAASYDQLKRWTLADRAYGQALKLMGPTAEFLNNRGYSYLLRGDIKKASDDLSLAAAKDPQNEHIQNNLKTLDARARKRI